MEWLIELKEDKLMNKRYDAIIIGAGIIGAAIALGLEIGRAHV
jgi:glycine/D-amino acid oxidase-like deaminating enzyme